MILTHKKKKSFKTNQFQSLGAVLPFRFSRSRFSVGSLRVHVTVRGRFAPELLLVEDLLVL